ncbi:MAG: peptidase papain, partial [Pedosphaera sp.]|nr:peptidase papain [Pedosphaera sp.]
GNGGAGGTGGNSSTQAGNGGSGGNGGTALGGAIYNFNTLLLSNCTFAGNSAIGGNGGAGGTNGTGPFSYTGAGGTGGLAEGAALYNAANANVTILACSFLDNFTQGGNSQAASGAPNSSGGGQTGPAGAAARGGSIFNASSNIIVNCTFFANLAVGGNGGNGGNAGSSGYSGTGGNGGNALGGSLYNESTGFVAVTNCTFDGGEVFGGTNGLNGTGSFSHGTGALGSSLGANIFNNSGVFQLKNSILAYPTNGLNASGTITDKGYNFSSDATPTLSPSTNNNVNPLLGALAANGGPTETIAIAGNSPARDAIFDASAPAFDQRGVGRPIGPRSDIGAFEFGTPQYAINGQVGTATAGIVVFAVGTNGNHSTVTDAGGNYSFANLSAGTYTITPSTTNGFTFTPVNQTIIVPPSTNGVNFSSVASYNVAGIISFATTPVTVNIYTTTNGNTTFFTQVSSAASTGLYTFTNVPGGNYTIVPQSPLFAFVPASISLTLPPSNTNENFNAVPPTYTVSGQVSNVHSAITLTDTLGTTTNVFSSTLSDTNGNYTFANLPASTFAITPQPTNGYTYTPTSLSVTVPPSTNAQNFSASQAPVSSVSGQVANLRQVVGIMAVSGSGTNTVSTDAGGNYSFASLPAGSYTIAPQAVSGLTFSPSSISVAVPPAAAGKNFAVMTATHSAIGNAHFAGNNFSFTISGTPNVVYRIQVATNLTSGVWVDIGTNTAAANGTISVTNNSAASSAELYYRAVTP